MDKFIIDEVQERQGDEAKDKYEKDMVREKTIIIDSIKDSFSIMYHHYLLQIK